MPISFFLRKTAQNFAFVTFATFVYKTPCCRRIIEIAVKMLVAALTAFLAVLSPR